MLTDGLVHDPGHGGVAAVVAAWRTADEVGRRLADVAGIEPPLIKACLVGPWTAGHRDPRAAAHHVVPGITALFEAGAPVVQLTEPGIGDIDPDDAVSLERLESVLDAVTAPRDGHISLAMAGGQPTRVPYQRLFAAPFASYLFDLIRSPDDWNLCARVPPTSGLIVGVGDSRTADPDTEAVSVWGGPICGITRRSRCRAGRPRDVRRAGAAAPGCRPGQAQRIAEAGRKADLSNAELAKVIDPRAVDARSAALGRYEPRRSGGRNPVPSPGAASSNPSNRNPGETVQPTSVQSPRVRAACQSPAGTTTWGRSPAARSMPSR